MDITLYHNPRCSKSRQTLALLEEHGVKPKIIEYLKTPPSATTLKQILASLGYTARELLRKNEPEFQSLNLADPHKSEDEIIQAMADYPKLIERPIVIKNKTAVIGRPPEKVLEILG